MSASLLRHIEAATARASAEGRFTRHIGPFLAVIHRSDPLPWLSAALPDPAAPHAVATPADIAALRTLFRAHGRVLRFEYTEALWPHLGEVLRDAGLALEGSMPMMVCVPADLRPLPTPGVRVEPLTAAGDDGALRAFLEVGRRSFGAGAVDAAAVAEQRAALVHRRFRCATGWLGDTLSGIGSMTVTNDELVGIATLPECRRRGVASAVSAYLVAQHFRHGAPLAWLSAGDGVAASVYRGIGFRDAGTQLNWTDTPAAPRP